MNGKEKKECRFVESRSETICVIFSRRKEGFVFITDFNGLSTWPLEKDDVYDGLLRLNNIRVDAAGEMDI